MTATARHGPPLLRLWAAWREYEGEDPAVVQEARAIAASMRDWRYTLHRPKPAPADRSAALLNVCHVHKPGMNPRTLKTDCVVNLRVAVETLLDRVAVEDPEAAALDIGLRIVQEVTEKFLAHAIPTTPAAVAAEERRQAVEGPVELPERLRTPPPLPGGARTDPEFNGRARGIID